jgi:hypothetical protein
MLLTFYEYHLILLDLVSIVIAIVVAIAAAVAKEKNDYGYRKGMIAITKAIAKAN